MTHLLDFSKRALYNNIMKKQKILPRKWTAEEKLIAFGISQVVFVLLLVGWDAWFRQMKKVLDKTLRAIYNIKYKLNIKLGVEMASAKNYTDEMVATMTEQYVANPTRDTVDALAREFGKTTRSIIAKLSREGVYVAQPRTTKTGEPIVSKNEIVNDIASLLQVEVDDIASLEKATKIDLKNLMSRLSEVVQ